MTQTPAIQFSPSSREVNKRHNMWSSSRSQADEGTLHFALCKYLFSLSNRQKRTGNVSKQVSLQLSSNFMEVPTLQLRSVQMHGFSFGKISTILQAL
jgi:hypothetical protein